jgi:hypothetical protein
MLGRLLVVPVSMEDSLQCPGAVVLMILVMIMIMREGQMSGDGKPLPQRAGEGRDHQGRDEAAEAHSGDSLSPPPTRQRGLRCGRAEGAGRYR